jgi:hypothetical protein
MNVNQQYMYILRFDIVILCVDETHYFMREYSDAIKLPESYLPPLYFKER